MLLNPQIKIINTAEIGVAAIILPLILQMQRKTTIKVLGKVSSVSPILESLREHLKI